jgi:hypothetical protein
MNNKKLKERFPPKPTFTSCTNLTSNFKIINRAKAAAADDFLLLVEFVQLANVGFGENHLFQQLLILTIYLLYRKFHLQKITFEWNFIFVDKTTKTSLAKNDDF